MGSFFSPPGSLSSRGFFLSLSTIPPPTPNPCSGAPHTLFGRQPPVTLPGVLGCRDPGGPASSVLAPPGPALRLPVLPWRRGQQSQPRATRAARLWAGPQREGGACAVHPGIPRYTVPGLASPGGEGGTGCDDRVQGTAPRIPGAPSEAARSPYWLFQS